MTFTWVKENGQATGACGVVHYFVGDTGLILNVMASIPENWHLIDAWHNASVCHWKESYANLRYGHGGCKQPSKAGNIATVDGFHLNLAEESLAKFEVTFGTFGGREFAIPPVLCPLDVTERILEIHREFNQQQVENGCVQSKITQATPWS